MVDRVSEEARPSVFRHSPDEDPFAGAASDLEIVPTDRRIVFLRLGTITFVVLSTISMGRMFWVGMPVIPWLIGIATIGAVLNVARLSLGADVERVAHATIGLLFAVLFSAVSATGGFYDPNFPWLFVPPLAASLVLGFRASLAWTALVVVATLGFWVLAGAGVEFPNYVPEASRHGQSLFNRLALLGCIVSLTGCFAITQRRNESSLALRHAALAEEAMCVRLLQEAAVAANGADDLDEAIDHCVYQIVETDGWELGLVWQPEKRSAEAGMTSSVAFAFVDRAQGALGPEMAPLLEHSRALRVEPGRLALGGVVSDGEPRWAFGADLEPESSPRGRAAAAAGLSTAVAIPVLVRGRTERIVELFSRRSTPPNAHLIAVLRDVGRQLGRVAERVQFQDSVRRSQKLESIGQLAAGIAHEIANPMAYVRSNLATLQGEWEALRNRAKEEGWPEVGLAELAVFEEMIQESQDGVDRTISIVRDVRDFARDGTAELETIALDELVESALRVVPSADASAARIERQIEGDLEFEGLATRLRQVVLNLVLNARYAAGAGGIVEVVASGSPDDVILTVTDDGPGIPAVDLERIFEPFYTTKPAGQGTGLGLYITHEVVRWHGGAIEVASRPGVGTQFVVSLPRRPQLDPVRLR